MKNMKTSRRAERTTLPLIPLREMVVFPRMIAPLLVGRDKSVNALQSALQEDRRVVLVAQRDPTIEDPKSKDLYSVGTVSEVLQIMKVPEGGIKVLVEGHSRAIITNYTDKEGIMAARLEMVEESDVELTAEVEAMKRAIVAQFENYLKLSQRLPPETIISVVSVSQPGQLSDVVAAHINVSIPEKQAILEIFDPRARLEKIMEVISHECELLEMEQKIRDRVRKQMEKTQKEYYLNEQIKAIHEELGSGDDPREELQELTEQIQKSGMTKEAQTKAERELSKLRKMQLTSPEATVSRNYIDWLVALPWKKKTTDRLNLREVEKVLNHDHYGLEKPKERILEFLAVRKLSKSLKGPILCFVGPPGVGKTSLASSIARALSRKFVRVSLGGVRDEAEIRGHRRTYIGALPGKIVQCMRKVGTINPVFLLDEVDKMSVDFRGDPSAALLEVLDPEQNHAFNDHYLEIDYDLSKVFFITTANVVYPIPPALQDRMEIIRLPGYTEMEKLAIAKQFLVPKQLKQCGLKKQHVSFSDNAIRVIIRRYTREAGVRNLDREIGAVCRKVAKITAEKRCALRTTKITTKNMDQYLGAPKFYISFGDEEPEVGVGFGLAWTDAGGEILPVETSLMKGKGKLTLTGQLGEIMQESAQAAVTYLRSHARQLKIRENFYNNNDIHIHVPEGAIPKDGPSAGVTMAVSLLSALKNRPCRRGVALTGEITLRGRVLPVGGIKEKVLAAHRMGLKIVIIPEENQKDLAEIPASVRHEMDIVLVKNIDEVFDKAFDEKHHSLQHSKTVS